MADQPPSRFNVTADNIRGYDWQSQIDQHPVKDCVSYYSVLVNAAKECANANDDLGSRVYALLYSVASFFPDYETKGNPFGPQYRDGTGNRAIMAEDLTNTDLDALQGIFEEITDPEFRARIGDVLWECRRNYKAAQAAVSAYLGAAEAHRADDLWPDFVERLERAAQLAAKLGFGNPLHQQVLKVIEDAIAEFEPCLEKGLLCHRLIVIAVHHDTAHVRNYAGVAERLAVAFARIGNHEFSHRYWKTAEHCFRQVSNEADALRCQLAAAESLITRADKGRTDPNLGFRYAAHWLGQGLEALRQAKANPARIHAIHLEFLAAEKKSLEEFTPLDIDFNQMPGFRDTEENAQKAAAAHVRGYSFDDAIARFVHITRPTDVAALKLRLENQSQDFIWDRIMGSEALDHSGKVADRMGPSGTGTPEEEAIIERKRMVQTSREIDWQIQVVWKIEPARRVIISEHPIRRADLFTLVGNNPFIPPGHEGIYLRGIQAGFSADWLVAMHLLIPQIEASLRHVLQQNGVVTSTLDADGIQMERDLNQLLWMPEIERIFGPGVAFDLCGILVERFGHNLRNESAHGLVPEAGFYLPSSEYLWWLVLYLCWIGCHMVEESPDKL